MPDPDQTAGGCQNRSNQGGCDELRSVLFGLRFVAHRAADVVVDGLNWSASAAWKYRPVVVVAIALGPCRPRKAGVATVVRE